MDRPLMRHIMSYSCLSCLCQPYRTQAEQKEHAKRKRLTKIHKTKSRLAFTLDQPLVAIFQLRDTMVPYVLMRLELWVFTGLHLFLFILKERGYEILQARLSTGIFQPSSDWTIATAFSSLAVPSGLMTLLLVFFNNQCYSRFTELYGACTGMAGALQELAQLTSVLMSKYPDERWDANRYALASCITMYCKATDLAFNRPQRMDPEDWERLLSSEEEWLGLPTDRVKMPAVLNASEVAVLKKCEGTESQVLQMWSLDIMFRTLERSVADGHVHRADHHFTALSELIFNLRGSMAKIPNLLSQPIPFPYYHAIVVLMFVNYTFYAVALLDINSWLTPAAMFLIVFTTTSIRELSSALANPFGEDEVDFNESKYVHSIRGICSFLSRSPAMSIGPPEFADRGCCHAQPFTQPFAQPFAQPAMQYGHNYESQGQPLQGMAMAAMDAHGDVAATMDERRALDQMLEEQSAQIAMLQASVQAHLAARASLPTPMPVSMPPPADMQVYAGQMDVEAAQLAPGGPYDSGPSYQMQLPVTSTGPPNLVAPPPLSSVRRQAQEGRGPMNTLPPLRNARRAPPLPAGTPQQTTLPSQQQQPPPQPSLHGAAPVPQMGRPLSSVQSLPMGAKASFTPQYQCTVEGGVPRFTSMRPAPILPAGAKIDADEEVTFERAAA